MGSPGAGKTTVGRILGHHLGKEVIDVDDDVLEKVWGISVAEKVQPSEKQCASRHRMLYIIGHHNNDMKPTLKTQLFTNLIRVGKVLF